MKSLYGGNQALFVGGIKEKMVIGVTGLTGIPKEHSPLWSSQKVMVGRIGCDTISNYFYTKGSSGRIGSNVGLPMIGDNEIKKTF